jgi:hypothetical protein
LKSEERNYGMDSSKKKHDSHDIIDTEVALQKIYDSMGGGYSSPELKEKILAL